MDGGGKLYSGSIYSVIVVQSKADSVNVGGVWRYRSVDRYSCSVL